MNMQFDHSSNVIVKKAKVISAIREEIVTLFGANLPEIRGKVPLIKSIMQACAVPKLQSMSIDEKRDMYVSIYEQIFAPVSEPEKKSVINIIDYLQPDIIMAGFFTRLYQRFRRFFRRK